MSRPSCDCPMTSVDTVSGNVSVKEGRNRGSDRCGGEIVCWSLFTRDEQNTYIRNVQNENYQVQINWSKSQNAHRVQFLGLRVIVMAIKYCKIIPFSF